MNATALKRSISIETLTTKHTRNELDLPSLFDEDLKDIYLKHKVKSNNKFETESKMTSILIRPRKIKKINYADLKYLVLILLRVNAKT
jgi:hypothetical protein